MSGDLAFALPLLAVVDGPGAGACTEPETPEALGLLGGGRRPELTEESEVGAKELDCSAATNASEPERWLGGTYEEETELGCSTITGGSELRCARIHSASILASWSLACSS